MDSVEGWDSLIERFRRDYFSDPARRMRLEADEVLMEQDSHNDRLYFVISGRFVGTVLDEDELSEAVHVELFEANPGDFLGVNSFFSRTRRASTRVAAVTEGELAWIDHQTPPVDPERYGNVLKQFVPLLIEESSRRQVRLSHTVRERAVALRRLHLAEQFSTLGQLAAGLAHELNNAVGVLEHSSERLVQDFERMLNLHDPQLLEAFGKGVASGQSLSSDKVRRRARELMSQHGIGYDVARDLARMAGDEPVSTLPDRLEERLAVWETGRDCHDMLLAGRHATAIVRSVKQLGGGGRQREEGIDVNKTLLEALSLLKSNLRQVTVDVAVYPELPYIWGNATELVQIWVNIIKNGWDALNEAHVAEPRLILSTARHRRGVEVRLANNGPEIPAFLRARLFQPNITTKRGSGASMGLGLGLYIVKRLVDSYSGELLVESTPEQTSFIIRLPLRHEELTVTE